jgi:hypothetical protein
METSILAKITANLHNLNNNEELSCNSNSSTLDNVILAVIFHLESETI